MWQEITVYIILAVTVAFIIRRIWIRFTCKPDSNPKNCDACIGCALKKRQQDKKH